MRKCRSCGKHVDYNFELENGTCEKCRNQKITREDPIKLKEARELSIKGLKKCPYCAETVKLEAIKCRHCQSDLSGNKTKTDSNITVVDGMKNGLGIIITLVLILILIVIIFR